MAYTLLNQQHIALHNLYLENIGLERTNVLWTQCQQTIKYIWYFVKFNIKFQIVLLTKIYKACNPCLLERSKHIFKLSWMDVEN